LPFHSKSDKAGPPRPVTRGAKGGEDPLEKCVGHNLKLLDVV